MTAPQPIAVTASSTNATRSNATRSSATRSSAALDGCDGVLPDDLHTLATPVLARRAPAAGRTELICTDLMRTDLICTGPLPATVH